MAIEEKIQQAIHMLQGSIHLNIKPVQRNKGQSIVARVAYQTASSIRDPRTGEWHNYRYKKKELGQTHLLFPEAVTIDTTDYGKFWADLEAHYKRGNSVPARTASLALPIELSSDENHELMLQYGRWLCDTYGVAVQVTSHKPHSSNPHFHLAITACTVLPDGSFGKKVISLDPISAQRELKQRIAPVEILRAQWANIVNAALKKSGAVERVDHRSYLRRGIQEIPQKHEGVWRHSSQDRVLGCPKEYNKNIETVNEVLHHGRREFQKFAIPRNSFGKNTTGGMGDNQNGTDRDQAGSASNEYGHQQPARRSKDAHGDYGRDCLGYGGRNQSARPGKAQSENSGRCHYESEQSADFYELTHDPTGNIDSTGDKGFSDLIIHGLVIAISALEMETMRLSNRFLGHESRKAKALLKLPSSGFFDVVAQEIMPLMTTLETEELRLQNKNSDLLLRTHPKIVLPTVDAPETAFGAMGRSYVIVPKLLNAISSLEVETLRLSHSILKHEERRVKEQLKLFSLVPTSASLMGIAFPPIVALTKKLAPAAAEMAFRFENFYKYVQEEAGGRHGAAFAPEHLKSGAIGTPGSNEMWHEKLWELLVATAVQEPDSLSVPSRLLNAHMKIQAIFPRITVVDFSHTLKKFSVRTPEERAVIIQSLAQRCPTQRPARIAISSQASRPSAARHPDTWRGELRPSQATPRTPVRPVQKKPVLQAPPTDSISAMRELWREIQNYAEKDGKIYFNSVEGKVKLQVAIKHVWINNPDIPFEFMHRTVFRRVAFDTATVEDMLRGTYNLISLQLHKFDDENIQQVADPLQMPHAQSSKALEDNDDDGNSMSFGHHICQ